MASIVKYVLNIQFSSHFIYWYFFSLFNVYWERTCLSCSCVLFVTIYVINLLYCHACKYHFYLSH